MPLYTLFMRIVLDEMPDDPDPVEAGSQATVVGYDGVGDLMVDWDNGRGLKVIPGIDRFHVVGTYPSLERSEEEIAVSFAWLRSVQEKLRHDHLGFCTYEIT